MSNKIIALSAALGMLGATAVSAQTTSPPTTEPQTPPAATSPMAPSTQTAPTSGASASTTGDRFLSQQQPGQRLATDYMKKSIHGANNERIGDVNNLLLSEDGQIVAVLVGVGGFLGIGEKTVALPLSALTQAPETNQLSSTFSRDDLEKAPEFVTRAEATRANPPPAAPGSTNR
ncbi:PRC-barrel domain-containing protein [Leptospira interrogans]